MVAELVANELYWIVRIRRDGGGSLDWSLLVTLSAIAAACLALGGAALVSTRDRRRVSTS